MGEIKSYVAMAIGSIISLLAPIQKFMYAMLLLFFLNFLFGFAADKLSGNDWDPKKAMKFILYCCIFFIATGILFVIGYLMGEMEQSVAVVKILCLAAVWVFGSNVFRNWREILTPGTAWYKFVDLVYYVLSVKFIERFQWVKDYQKQCEKKQSTNTVLDKDDS